MAKKKSAKAIENDARWHKKVTGIKANRKPYSFDEEEYLGLAEPVTITVGGNEVKLLVLRFKTGSLGLGTRKHVKIPVTINDEVHVLDCYILVTATIKGSKLPKQPGYVRTVRLPQPQLRNEWEYVDEHIFDCPHDPREDEEGFHPEYSNLPELNRQVGSSGHPPSALEEEDDGYQRDD